ncbi:unnamed protein product [Adineta ricciae]|uniref:Uncharacterized protein n=1 Tax=Adineta ricciae TaxID=249248 RepID=A0A813ML15_ADIRI|nr:unnamed protein product [Adineta ricciae]CAF1321629.1 unnamed protein product [Adineta ricciae]
MSSTTNIIWLQSHQDELIPNELRSHVALFTNEDACYQFLCSLSTAIRGLTLVITDSNIRTDRLVELKPISCVYILSPPVSKSSLKPSTKFHGFFKDRKTLVDQILSDLNRRKATKPGFFSGIFAPFQGLYFILKHKSTWSRALIPCLIFTLLLFVCAIPGVWGMHILTARLIQRNTSRLARVGIWILRLAAYFIAICLSLIIALLTAQPLSSPALESLVRAQERELKYPIRPEESFCSSVWRSLRIATFSLLISFVIFIVLTSIEFFVPPLIFITTPLKFLTTAWIIAYDIIDYPLSLHLLGVRERTPWFRHYLWATMGFGISIEMMFLIPGAFFLLLPAAVCGATRLVVAAERASIDQPLLMDDEAS